MRTAYIAAGAGDMVCGSCIHDNALAAALQARGEDALLLPIYTPLRSDEPSAASERVFYGAINIYLEQRIPWLRHLPGFVHRLLDRPGVLRRISTSSSTVDASQLGELTLSMLQGEDGRQKRELDELVVWLRDVYRPDIVHLAYSMLLGMAPALRASLGVPLVCSLQGEDIFWEDLHEPYKSRCLEAMRERAAAVDMFVATNDHYAALMSEALGIPEDRMAVARLGITLDGHLDPATPVAVRREGPLRLGYLARICPEKGLHLLCDAFRLLDERLGRGNVELHVAGYLGGRDRVYFDDLRRRVEEWGLADHWHHAGQVDRDEKIRFLQRLDVFSLPTLYLEPKGLSVLEAMANGIPVVQPAHGGFPEMIERCGGGVLVEPGSPVALADAVEALWLDPERRRQLGTRGRETVRRDCNAEVMAERTLEIYRELLGSGDPG